MFGYDVRADGFNGSSNYGLGPVSSTPAWLFPVVVFRTQLGK